MNKADFDNFIATLRCDMENDPTFTAEDIEQFEKDVAVVRNHVYGKEE